MTSLRETLDAAFFRWGWLIVAVLPLAQTGGRALYTVLVGIYGLWGLPGLWSRWRRLDRATTLIYLALLGVMLAGIPGSLEPEGGFRVWIQYAFQTSTLLLIQAALRESPAHPDRLFDAFALFGGINLIILYLLLPYYELGWSGEPFDPKMQLKKDNLPFLLMFLLGWLWWRGGRRRRGAMAAVTAAVLTYVIVSEGRAALFGMIAGLAVFCWSVLGWRPRWVASTVVLLLAVGMVANTGVFHQIEELDPDNPVDSFTTGRSILWRQALEHPPARPWLGVGIDNGRYAVEMLTFEIGGVLVRVRHLHNLLLDAWHETGILGVGLWLALIGAVLGRLAWVWRRLSAGDRQRAGVLLAAAMALVAAGMLSFSYTSRQLSCYLFVCLAGLIHFSRAPGDPAMPPADGRVTPDRC